MYEKCNYNACDLFDPTLRRVQGKSFYCNRGTLLRKVFSRVASRLDPVLTGLSGKYINDSIITGI